MLILLEINAHFVLADGTRISRLASVGSTSLMGAIANLKLKMQDYEEKVCQLDEAYEKRMRELAAPARTFKLPKRFHKGT